MLQTILAIQDIHCRVRVSHRAKYMRIEVGRDGSVVAIRPKCVSIDEVRRFVESRWHWIQKSLARWGSLGNTYESAKLKEVQHQESYRRMRDKAYALAEDLIAQYNARQCFPINKISIRNQKTRWGSCSSKGNICLNWRIVELPRELAEYIVVHELCHLKQMNHSKKFWKIVEDILPDWRERRRNLKKYDR